MAPTAFCSVTAVTSKFLGQSIGTRWRIAPCKFAGLDLSREPSAQQGLFSQGPSKPLSDPVLESGLYDKAPLLEEDIHPLRGSWGRKSIVQCLSGLCRHHEQSYGEAMYVSPSAQEPLQTFTGPPQQQ